MPRVDERAQQAIRYGWMPLLALAATQALESGERLSLSQSEEGIRATFHVSDAAIGLLPFGMAVVGLLGAFPIGFLADRSRRTTLLAWAMAVWTVCMVLNGFAATFGILFLCRLGVGAVEANSPASVSLLADYYPAATRARTMSLYQSGALIGALIGIGLGGVVVDAFGWRWAFWMWAPLGALVALFVARQPEPRRGHQDAHFGQGVALTEPGGPDIADLTNLVGLLPPPNRIGTLDYAAATPRQVARELLRIRTMWFGVLALTVSQTLLTALQFWGIPYFKRVHELSAVAAGGASAVLGSGSAIGILAGGFLADRYLRRGVVCARIYVVAIGSVGATLVLMPALASTSLHVTMPLFFAGGILLTLPVAPAEAIVSDVVVAQLRGRASAVRAFVRSASYAGPPLVGLVSSMLAGRSGIDSADGLRYALVAITPIYAVGGLAILLAARSYPADLAFVVHEARGRLSPD